MECPPENLVVIPTAFHQGCVSAVSPSKYAGGLDDLANPLRDLPHEVFSITGFQINVISNSRFLFE